MVLERGHDDNHQIFRYTIFKKNTIDFSTTKKMDIVECVFSIKSDVILRDLDFTINDRVLGSWN